MLKRHFLTIVVMIAAALAGMGAWLAIGHLFGPTSRNTDALFALKLQDSEGKTIDFSQWRGKPMVVNFWATWCAPCREEMPVLDRVARTTPTVQFVGIAVDDAAHVTDFRSKNTTSYPLPITGMEISSLAKELGNSAMALPFTAFVSADGKLRAVKLGAMKEAELQNHLDGLLKR